MNNETLNDIIRDMRDPENDYITNNDLRDLADRIEAAAQREKVEAVTIAATKAVNLTDEKWLRDTGNAAATRAALEGLLAWLDQHGDSYTYLDGTPADEVKAIWPRRQEIVSQARAALSAPPRNCDRYDVEDSVTACMQAIDAAWHEIDTIRATIGWMLATAEGGAR